MEQACNFFESLTVGINSLFEYDNIAIGVLLAMVIFLLHWINKILNNNIVADGIMRDALNEVKITIAVLNERLGHDHGKEDE